MLGPSCRGPKVNDLRPKGSQLKLSMDLPQNLLFWFFFLSSFFSLLVVPDRTLASSPYLGAPYLTCMHNTTNGTSLSSSFKRNLNSALQNLTSLSSTGTKYAQTTAGAGNNMVYAMFQCRGDQSTALCAECVANATVRLPQRECPVSIGARIQLDGCYLRYDNKSFFTLDVSYAQGYCYGKTTDPVVLSTINSLVENVTTQAPKQGGFASASGDGEYAAAQCLGYLNESECSECLSNVPYRTLCDSSLGEQVHLTSCYYRFEPYAFLAPLPSPVPGVSPTQQASPPRLPPAQSESHTGSKTPMIAAIIASAVAIVVVIALCLVVVWRRKVSKKTEMLGKKEVKRQASWPQPLMQVKARVFSLSEMKNATRHFHLDNKLGEGGFGSVYKGTLPNGEQVAVKKLALGSSQGRQEFLNEVTLITGVQHKNLVRLLGCCIEESERILVYEYLPNKSLDLILFEQQDGKVLDWQARYGIVLGMAKGLAYLHEESYIRIIHRDIKPSNVLLDNQLNPIIADFGLARLVQANETHINTGVAGTRGYLAPEYVIHGELSEKADVFSYGVVALEIISGRQNLNNGVLEWAWRLFTQKKILDLIDTKLGIDFSVDQVIRIAHIGLLCTQESPYQRPTMSQVVLMLSGNSEILELPCKPAFIDLYESTASGSTSNHQPRSTFSLSSITNTHNSFINDSHALSNAAHSISEFIDPR